MSHQIIEPVPGTLDPSRQESLASAFADAVGKTRLTAQGPAGLGWSGRRACAAALSGRELVVWQAHKGRRVAAVVGDLHESALTIGFYNGARRPGGPAPRRGEELDYPEDGVSRFGHA